MRAPAPPLPALLSRSCSSAPRLLLSSSSRAPAASRPPRAVARSVSVSVEAPAAAAEPAVAGGPSATPRRRLILLRHGESAAGGRSTRDHDRPLSKAGRADAISVSNKLQQMGWIPELILCSDAMRTKETLKILQEHVQGLSQAVVHFIPSFYSIAAMDGQTAEHLQKAICEYSSDEILTVMCMGHNKGWEEAASMFSGDSVVLETCNAALLEAAGKSWVEAFSLAGLGGWKLHGIVKP
ncbi:uncharacterized protein At3g52155, chloroplastic-like [Panicum virgatum]|uniref:Uncharacterized protein n=1 Tax=Panicum virgatum TaxID=38727 RepID=A0A8T0WCN7_PANVG|nr:uncharacterized protein At3g52155, chloroplastic-like [Panicum virgatum]KAG2642443.1 hypothetical protein PVAP13_2KG278800 [Panicum virgatum]